MIRSNRRAASLMLGASALSLAAALAPAGSRAVAQTIDANQNQSWGNGGACSVNVAGSYSIAIGDRVV